MPLWTPTHSRIAIAILALASSLHAQGTKQQPTGALSLNARLVMLDVVVTDASGKPFPGLTARDFRVLEDGKPQTIRGFEPPSMHTLPAETLNATADTVLDPAEPAKFGQSPVTVIVLDQLNTHFADSSFARRSVRDFLLKQPELLPQPASLLTVYDNQFKQLHAFTRSRAQLLQSLDAAPVKMGWNLELNGSADYGPLERLEQSLQDIEQIAQSYARIPGRKNMIWVGGGFPSLDPELLDNSNRQIVESTTRHVIDLMLATRITVYAVDPTSSAAGMTEITNLDQADAVNAMGGSAGVHSGNFDPNDSFDQLGPLTGGRVVRGLNNVAQQIASAVSLGADFYTLSYTPTSSSDQAAKFRKISVICLRPGLTASTRSGYFATPANEASPETAAYDLTIAAQGHLPLNGLHISVEPDPASSAPPHTYIVHVTAGDLTWQSNTDGTATAHVYVMGASLNAKDQLAGQTVHPMVATANAGADLRDASRQANFVFTCTPAARATTLRFVVRDSATGRMGSTDIPLTPH